VLSVQYPSDVIAGVGIGAALVLLSAAVTTRGAGRVAASDAPGSGGQFHRRGALLTWPRETGPADRLTSRSGFAGSSLAMARGAR
jgi:hypothetical protein